MKEIAFVGEQPGQARAGADPEPFGRDAHGKPLLPLDSASVYQFGSLIRAAETTLLELFTQGALSGTTHTCLGQELCQMAVVRALHDPNDAIVSNHRNHGHFLTYSGDFTGLLAEIMGRQRGVCGGVGGSQHLAYRNFHSNGVQAGMTANGVGQALYRKRRGEAGVVAIVVGDGTLGEGLLYESLNLAAIWKLRVLFVVENNRIAQTTPTEQTIGGSIRQRGEAFGLATWQLDDASPEFLQQVEQIVERVRTTSLPGLLVVDTMRLGPHSKGDDARPEQEMRAIRERDPLAAVGRKLTEARKREIDEIVASFIGGARRKAEESPESFRYLERKSLFNGSRKEPRAQYLPRAGNVRASLNQALDEMLSAHPEVIVLGEDLHEPYGGAFKVTSGLSAKYPGRVISTPISEAGITGVGIGLALSGFKPIVEIMFADFITLTMDQLYNHAVKLPGMFPHCSVPLVLRTPSGGRRGYGPTHSQCPEGLACAIPGLTVVFPSHRHCSGSLLERAVLDWPYPTVFFEHKLVYGLQEETADYQIVESHADDYAGHLFPLLRSGSSDPDVTIVAYGHSLTIAESAAEKLRAEELEVEILTPSLLSPLPIHTFLGALANRERVVILEEAPTPHGWGAELTAGLAEHGFSGAIRRVGAPPIPVPAARSLEHNVLPQPDSVVAAVLELLIQ
jgi:2-oxoisovalerate dehydrogenase E1 component